VVYNSAIQRWTEFLWRAPLCKHPHGRYWNDLQSVRISRRFWNAVQPRRACPGEGPIGAGGCGLAGIAQLLRPTGRRASSGPCPSVESITQRLTEPLLHRLRMKSPRGGRHRLSFGVMADPSPIAFPCGTPVTLSPFAPQVPISKPCFPAPVPASRVSLLPAPSPRCDSPAASGRAPARGPWGCGKQGQLHSHGSPLLGLGAEQCPRAPAQTGGSRMAPHSFIWQ